MALKGIGKVTITLDRTTVEMLRSKKDGLETWDALMHRLAGRKRNGIECILCGKWLETTEAHISPSILAELNGWHEVIIKEGRGLGFICPLCGADVE